MHLDRYRKLCEDKRFYSLTQNPLVMKRTEDKNSDPADPHHIDGPLAPLLHLLLSHVSFGQSTCSESIGAEQRSEDKKRLVTPQELFLSLGLPSFGPVCGKVAQN